MTATPLLTEQGHLTEPGRLALIAAAAHQDPKSLAAATSMRKDFPAELAAAALSQESLRRRAGTKFGADGAKLFFTPAGLEQATRPVVSRWRAEQLLAGGVRVVADLGCGIGADSRAFCEADLDVVAVERDPATAIFARANLGTGVEVIVGDAESVAVDDDRFVFADPARRDGSGRVWNVEDFSPGWDFVTGLLRRPAGAWIKLGPALPHRLIPDGIRATWVSVAGSVVEAALTGPEAGPLGEAEAATGPANSRLRAVLLPPSAADAPGKVPFVSIDGTTERAVVGQLGSWLHEPDGAVIRAGAVATLAIEHDATGIADQIAYLTSSAPMHSPFATDFEVLDVLPYKEKVLRQWVRTEQIGTLEIKKRGIDLDPAELRRRLKPKGPNGATIVLTPTPTGAKALVVQRRLGAAQSAATAR